MKKLLILLLLLSGCSKELYLEPTGQVVEVGDCYIRIAFKCHNSRNPTCFGATYFSKDKFPFAYIGQKITLTNKIE
jgi:hypothetical protein